MYKNVRYAQSTTAYRSCVLTRCRVADDSHAVDFDPQAVLDDVKKLLGVEGDGDGRKVDSSSDVSGDDDSDVSSSEGLGKLVVILQYMAQYCHSMYWSLCHTSALHTCCLSLHNTWALCRRGSRDAGHYGRDGQTAGSH